MRKIKFNKKVIIWSLIFFLLGIMVSPSNQEKIIIEKDCPECEYEVNNCDEIISLYERVLVIDADGFKIAAETANMVGEAGIAGFNYDIDTIENITARLENNNARLNALADKKNDLMSKIELLR